MMDYDGAGTVARLRTCRRWVITASAVGLACVTGSPSAGIAIIKGPYLQKVAQTSIVVMWETDVAATGTVEYGPTAGYGWSATDSRSVTIHEVQVTGLTPDSLYHYRAVSGDASSSDATFQTAPPPGVPFRFAAYGDSQTYASEHQRVINRMVATAPRLVIHVGDMVTDGNAYSQWGPQFFAPAAPLIRNTPMALALGNHEHSSHWYYDFFSNPMDSGTEAWYEFRYGDARFVCLDTNQTHTSGSAQYNWLHSTLAEPTDAIWTFVYFHHPPYTSGSHSPHTTVQVHLVPLFEQYGVDIVFNGHCHDYERSLKDGVTYIVTGGGGGLLGPVRIRPNPYQVYARSIHHHCVIDIDGGRLTCRGVRADNGDEFDEFTLTRTTATTSPTLSSGWHLISLPFEPEDPDPAVVFAGISINQALFRYDTTNKGYVGYLAGDPGGLFGPVASGVGYWLDVTEPHAISYQGIQTATTQTIPLAPDGWTLIGHPFLSAVPLSAVEVHHPGLGETKGLLAAKQAGWIELPWYYYDSTARGYQLCGLESWHGDDWLRPWQGYWVAAGPDTVQLRVPAPE